MNISFDSRVNDVIVVYEDAIKHFASRTWQMIEKYGKAEALFVLSSMLMVTGIHGLMRANNGSYRWSFYAAQHR
jgi:hypothetical protein